MRTLLSFMMLVGTNSFADVITLTMNEVPTQLIDGLAVTRGGLNFTFSNASRTLFYNSGGPGTLTFVQDPTIQGSPGAFGVAFSAPVNSIQFGLAELASGLIPLATVELFNGSTTPFATVGLTATLSDPFSEGQFNFSDGAVTNIRVTPNPTVLALAFDNLTVNTVTTAVPEPSGVALIGTGVGLLLLIGRRDRRGRGPQ